jgi:hypothetical protein
MRHRRRQFVDIPGFVADNGFVLFLQKAGNLPCKQLAQLHIFDLNVNLRLE